MYRVSIVKVGNKDYVIEYLDIGCTRIIQLKNTEITRRPIYIATNNRIYTLVYLK